MAVVLLLLNIIICADFSYYPDTGRDEYLDSVFELYYSDPEKFYSEYERIKDESHHAIDDDYEMSSIYGGGVISDNLLFSIVDATVNADKTYHEALTDILNSSRSISMHYERTGREDSFTYRYNRRLTEVYAYLDENVHIKNTYIRGWDTYFRYTTDFFAAFLLVVVIAVVSVTEDRACGLYAIASACRNGRGRTVAAKLCASLILTAAVIVIFSAATFTVTGICSRGYSDPSEAAQAIDRLQLMPLRVSVRGAVFVSVGLKLASALLFCSVFFALTSIIKGTVLSIAAGIGIIVGSYAGYVASLSDSRDLTPVRYLNIWCIHTADIFAEKYRAFDLFGFPCGLWAVMLALLALAVVISLILACIFYPKENFLLKLRFPKLLRRGVQELGARVRKLTDKFYMRFSLSLSFYEIYKQRAMLVLLAALTVIKLFVSAAYYAPPESVFDKSLKEYVSEIGGEYTEEKAEYIRDQYESYSEVLNNFDKIEDAFWHGEMSSETYEYYHDEYREAVYKTDALGYLAERADYLSTLRETRGFTGVFVYDAGYNKYMSQGVDWLLLLFVAALSCRMYLFEHKKPPAGTSLIAISNATKLGRDVMFRKKAFICAIMSSFAWWLFRMIDLYFLFTSYEMPDMSVSILNLPQYEGSMFNFSIRGYIVISAALSLLGVLMISALAFSIGLLFKRAIFVYPITAAILLIPQLAVSTKVPAAEYLDFTALYDIDRLYRLSPAGMPQPIYCILFAAVIACLLALLTVYSSNKVKKGRIN